MSSYYNQTVLANKLVLHLDFQEENLLVTKLFEAFNLKMKITNFQAICSHKLSANTWLRVLYGNEGINVSSRYL